MDKKIIITKRFRNNTLRVYQYLLKEFSSRTAYNFLKQLETRIEFIATNSTAGKLSAKKKNIRSILFTPHKSFIVIKTILLKYFACLKAKESKEETVLNFAQK